MNVDVNVKATLRSSFQSLLCSSLIAYRKSHLSTASALFHVVRGERQSLTPLKSIPSVFPSAKILPCSVKRKGLRFAQAIAWASLAGLHKKISTSLLPAITVAFVRGSIFSGKSLSFAPQGQCAVAIGLNERGN